MKAWNVTEDDVLAALAAANAAYGGNIAIENMRTEGKTVLTVSFTLRAHDNAGAGCRWTKQRRTTSACWHVHRDVLRELFDVHPDARVKTMLADYRGRDSFLAEFPETRFVGCWQGGAPDRANAESCSCGNQPRPFQRLRQSARENGRLRERRERGGSDSVSCDAHRVAALADEELAAWSDFLAQVKKGG